MPVVPPAASLPPLFGVVAISRLMCNSFDPHKVKTRCGLKSQLCPKFVPQICVALVALLRLTTCTAGRNAHYILTVSDLISRFPSCTCIAAMTANNSARLSVCSRPGKVKEQFLSSLMPKNFSTACFSEPRVLIADTRPTGPGHDTGIVFGFPFESRIRKDTVWQGVATDRMCSCARLHVCPSNRLRVLQKDTKEAQVDHVAARVVSWYCSTALVWQGCRCLPWIR